jgi:hypothetical protein
VVPAFDPDQRAVTDVERAIAVPLRADTDGWRRLFARPIKRPRQRFALVSIDAGDLDHQHIGQFPTRRVAPAPRAFDFAVARQLPQRRLERDLRRALDAECLGDLALADFPLATANELEDLRFRGKAGWPDVFSPNDTAPIEAELITTSDDQNRLQRPVRRAFD